MQDKLVQSVRYKLQKRVRRLHSSDYTHFDVALRVFFQFFESSPLLRGVRDELIARTASESLAETIEQITKGKMLLGTTEREAAALGYLLLKRYAENPEKLNIIQIGYLYSSRADTTDGALDMVRELFLEPFYEYVDEHLDDQQAILYFLRRYKHRCEWFHAERLRGLLEQDTQKGEQQLAFDLYEFLHAQGIDFHIEPASASGIADFVADQVGDDRVVADAKIFWPEKSKGKAYIISAFHQAYTYARDYNEPCAYLVIFKMCREDVNLLVPPSDSVFPCLSVNNKTVFFVVVDICQYGVPASKRGPFKAVDISEKELIQNVEPGQPSAV